ncbi:MAG: hypothetical protein GSR81_05580 [Desulfurococcales archaeon]|nr:hypothetical protein [Desulfurococcales archaeon]
MLSLNEWRRNRDKAGILLDLVYNAQDGAKEKAWQIYKKWANAEITCKEAKKQLEKLAGKA